MIALKDVSGTTLAWVQPQTSKRIFELRDGGETIATLEWKKLFGSLAEFKSAEGEWTFKREGFLNPRVTIRRAGRDDNLAVFKPGWWGDGFVEFADGRRFKWAHTNFWGTNWAILDAEDDHIADMRPTGGLKSLLKLESTVEISPVRRNMSDLSLLIALGWYLIILMADDGTAAAVTTTAI